MKNYKTELLDLRTNYVMAMIDQVITDGYQPEKNGAPLADEGFMESVKLAVRLALGDIDN